MGNVTSGPVVQPPEWLIKAREELNTRIAAWGTPNAAMFGALLTVDSTIQGIQKSSHALKNGTIFTCAATACAFAALFVSLFLGERYRKHHLKHPLHSWWMRVAWAVFHVASVAAPLLLFVSMFVPEKVVWIPLTVSLFACIYYISECIRQSPPPIPGPEVAVNEASIALTGLAHRLAIPSHLNPADPYHIPHAVQHLANMANQNQDLENPNPLNPSQLAFCLSLALISNPAILNNLADPGAVAVALGHLADLNQGAQEAPAHNA